MRYRALDVFIGPGRRRVGVLFQYGAGRNTITRLVPERTYWMDDTAPILSRNAWVSDRDRRAVFLSEYAMQPFFNGDGEALPNFFQNMLPEGPLRRHLEEIGGLDKGDHMGLLSLCGTDLPGAVYVSPASTDRDSMARIVTQNNDALEMSVSPMPMPEATSLSPYVVRLRIIEVEASKPHTPCIIQDIEVAPNQPLAGHLKGMKITLFTPNEWKTVAFACHREGVDLKVRAVLQVTLKGRELQVACSPMAVQDEGTLAQALEAMIASVKQKLLLKN